MFKDYRQWFTQKKKLDEKTTVPSFKEREIWWCQIGVNVGYEILGKGQSFSRPVLVLKKYSKYTFLGAPLSTKAARFPLHYEITVNNKPNIIMLDQLRTFDARRLQQSPIQRITPTQYKKLKAVLSESL